MVTLREMTPADAQTVLKIYQQGIDTAEATFESIAPSWAQWDEGHLQECRIIATQNEQVVGWAALSPVSSRCVYGGVAEVSVYIGQDSRGQGVGLKLLNALNEASESAGYWTLQSQTFPENEASVALHQSAGFRIVGARQKLAKMSYGPNTGKWRDVVLMERRSENTGAD